MLRGGPAYCTARRSRTPVAMEAVIYIVLFARTKVAMKANKMLLIIQGRLGAARVRLNIISKAAFSFCAQEMELFSLSCLIQAIFQTIYYIMYVFESAV